MEWLKDWIMWAWEFVAWVFRTIGETIIGTLLEVFPLDGFLADNAVGTDYGGFKAVVDAWIPLSEGIGLMTAVVGVQLALIVVKWVFKVIPGMGG